SQTMVPARQSRTRVKREHGEAYPSGAESVAAPATVSGERCPNATGLVPGRRTGAMNREPGDLPSAAAHAFLRLSHSSAHGGCAKEADMHIEPGVVDGAKILLSVATAVASVGLIGKMSLD